MDGFPLTPALSPSERERENRRRSVGESGVVGGFVSRTLLFPLPRRGREGWGEISPKSNFARWSPEPADRRRSADWQSAVSRIGNPQPPLAWARSADCQSAIQQVANLRYKGGKVGLSM